MLLPPFFFMIISSPSSQSSSSNLIFLKSSWIFQAYLPNTFSLLHPGSSQTTIQLMHLGRAPSIFIIQSHSHSDSCFQKLNSKTRCSTGKNKYNKYSSYPTGWLLLSRVARRRTSIDFNMQIKCSYLPQSPGSPSSRRRRTDAAQNKLNHKQDRRRP